MSSKKCFFHPQQNLHNFCVNSHCALPLCPRCINIHLKQVVQHSHHIQSLDETENMISEQLITSIEAIEHELNVLKNSGEYTPQSCMQQYEKLIQKYRQEAIEQIKSHYDSIKRQVFQQLKSRYQTNLAHLIIPLEQNRHQLLNYQRLLQQKPIESLVKLISEDKFLHVQKFLHKIGEKKNDFKTELPRLQGIQGNKLKIIQGLIPSFRAKGYIQPKSVSFNASVQNTLRFNDTMQVYSQENQLDRIKNLETQLMVLRGTYY